MRHRRWVVFVILLLILLPPLAVVTVRVASERPGFREGVLARIMPDVGAELSVGDLSLGIASLTMSDIVVDLGERGTLRVPRVSVDISLQRFITTGFDLRRAVSSVLIDSPSAEIVLDAPRDAAGQRGDEPSRKPPDPAVLDELFPDYVAVSDGRLTLLSVDGGSLTVRAIDAIALRDVDGAVTGSLSGRLEDGGSNLSGELEADARGATFTLELGPTELRPGLPVPAASPVDVASGVASARALVTVDTAGVGVTAHVSLSRAGLELNEPAARLRDVDAEATYDGRLVIDSLTGRWDATGVEAKGAIDLSRDRFDALSISLEGASLERVLAAAGAGTLDVTGAADLDIVLDGPFDTPRLSMSISRADGRTRGLGFSGVSGSLVVQEGVVRLESLDGAVLGGRAGLTGRADLETGLVELSGAASALDAGLVSSALGGPEAAGRIDLTDAGVSVSDGEAEGEALLRWSGLRLGPVSPGDGAGGVVLLKDLLAVTLESPATGWRASAEIGLAGDAPDVTLRTLFDSLRVGSLVRLPPRLGATRIDGQATLIGPVDALSLDGAIAVSGPLGSADIGLEGGVDLEGADRSLHAELRGEPVVVRGLETALDGALEVGPDGGLFGSVTLDRVGRIEGRIGPGPSRTISAGLVVSEARVADIFRAASGDDPPRDLDGYLFVSASASGTLERPVISGQLELADASLAGVDELASSGEFRLSNDTLRVVSLSVREGDDVFLRGGGTVALDGPVSLSLAGEGVPGPMLGGDMETRFDATVGIGGTTDDPTVDGRFESTDGTFLGIPFDVLLARVTGARGALRLSPLVLERRGDYRLSAEGTFPVAELGEDAGDAASLDISVDGDPVALLVEAAGFGESGRGRGSLRASLSGDPGEMVVASAVVDATSPSVRPHSITDELTDVSVDLEIVDGSVVRGYVSGFVDGREVRLESARRRTVEGRMLPPLDVAGVDVGVLSLTTDGAVSVSIPGLMSGGEVGRMDVRGPGGGAEFFVTGPGEKPTLLGEVEFSDLSFLYPFEGGDGDGGPNPVLDSEWALTIRAGRNVWYRRADADVKVEEGGALEFRGTPSEGTLCVRGRLEATRGTVTYLNRDFDLQTAFVDFPFFCEPPRFFVEAETRVEDGTTVTLTMDSYEPALTFAGPGATIDESAITLSSDAPEDDSEEEILSRLQYGMGFALLEGEEQAALERRQALDVVGGQLSMRVVRPILAPVETRIRRNLSLDLVRIDIDFVEHFLSQLDLWRAQEGSALYLPLLVRSRITLGKYLSRDWLLSYVGTTRAYQDEIAEQNLGLRHELGIEYEVSRNTSLSMRVVYDPVIQGWDRRLSIENRYEF